MSISSKVSRLPSRFPVGTRYVIEGQGGHVHLRYLEFPDGRQILLPPDLAPKMAPDLPPKPRRKPASRSN
jgi:hypothetical protein